MFSYCQARESTTQSSDKVASEGSPLMSLLPLLLIIVVFYFFLIRPQQKKLKQHNEMLKSLNKGDEVVTSGGLYATIIKIEESGSVIAEVASDVRIKIKRDAIAEILKHSHTSNPSPSKSVAPAAKAQQKAKAAKSSK